MKNSSTTPDFSMIPLGLFGLGVAIFLYGAYLLHWITGFGALAAFGLGAGGLGMLTTGYWAFRAHNAFGGVAQSTVGLFFVSSGAYFWFFASSAPDRWADTGWVALAYAVVVGFLAIASFNAKVPIQASILLIVLCLFFILVWVGAAFHMPSALGAAGIAAIIAAILAWIGGFLRLWGTLAESQ